MFELTDAERADRGIAALPGTLGEAIEAASASALVREALGDHVFGTLLRSRRDEWERYQRHVSDFELAEYLPRL